MLRRLSRKELNDRQVLSKFLDFLNSSIWALPVATFIEQRSIGLFLVHLSDKTYGFLGSLSHYNFQFMCGLIPSVLQLEDGESLCNKSALSPEETERYVLISVMR
uniref:GAF domain-containing protein n=1 Tax=Heterorhabditis bacteriophora TaxID=37862 RepID=A0A1I7XMQ9_HETBA